jgi:hypothetical protein
VDERCCRESALARLEGVATFDSRELLALADVQHGA